MPCSCCPPMPWTAILSLPWRKREGDALALPLTFLIPSPRPCPCKHRAGGTFALYTRLCRSLGITPSGAATTRALTEHERSALLQAAAAAAASHALARRSRWSDPSQAEAGTLLRRSAPSIMAITEHPHSDEADADKRPDTGCAAAVSPGYSV